jgi:hypothetical protein
MHEKLRNAYRILVRSLEVRDHLGNVGMGRHEGDTEIGGLAQGVLCMEHL